MWLYHRFHLSHRDVEGLMAERGRRKFKSVEKAQRFLGAHAAVDNLFNLGRHLVSAETYRYFRRRSFVFWEKVVAMKREIAISRFG